MTDIPLKSLFDPSLSGEMVHDTGISRAQADALYQYFRNSSLFKWNGYNNDCEDRANAICILLDKWNVPNYKGWVFSGSFLKRGDGYLRNFWNFHVAALIAVKEGAELNHYIIDPAVLEKLETIDLWADKVTEIHGSVHFITSSDYYIFIPGKISRENWFRRNRQNYKWTIQGLSGINGVTRTGKAQLSFCKKRISKTDAEFRKLMNRKPDFI